MTVHPFDDEIPNVPEIVPNHGFMIAADGTRVRSVFETPRTCIGCGADFLPPKTPSRRIAETCSEPCRRHYARKEIGVSSSIDRAEKHTTRTVKPLDPSTSYPAPPTKAGTTPRPTSPHVPVPKRRNASGRFVRKGAPDAFVDRDESTMPSNRCMFGQAVEKRRLALGMAQKDVAKAIGVPPSTLRNWLCGQCRPPPHRLEALATFFDCTPEDLWNDR